MYSFDLSFPNNSFSNCIFRIILSELYFQICVLGLISRFVYLRLDFSVVADYHFSIGISVLFFSIHVDRFSCSVSFFLFAFRIVIPRLVFSELSFPIFILRIVVLLFYSPICIPDLHLLVLVTIYDFRFIYSGLYLPMCSFRLVSPELYLLRVVFSDL